ncbi:MAG: GNAT family N-acetyltransferase [Clostridiales bacterium]|nr:GNAT family N-acetyltransferase [Clostridiales bacterium]
MNRIDVTMRIETERLIIKPYGIEDLSECFHLMQDKILFRYLDMDVLSLVEYKRLFTWLIDSYETTFDDDFRYSFNITLKESGKHIGWCGIGVLDYDVSYKEIYYLIGQKYWNSGYAKEATKALLDYGFNVIGLNEIVALCKKENIASQKVIKKVGFEFKYSVKGLPKEFDFYNGELYYSLNKKQYVK